MPRAVPLTILGVLLVLAGLTSALSYHEATHAPTGVTMVATCTDHAVARPAAMTLSCADANSALRALHWSDWGDTTAYATGTITWNNCTPDCAAGTWKGRPVTVWAWRIRGRALHPTLERRPHVPRDPHPRRVPRLSTGERRGDVHHFLVRAFPRLRSRREEPTSPRAEQRQC